MISGTFATLVFPLLKRALKLEAQYVNLKEKASERIGLQWMTSRRNLELQVVLFDIDL